MCACFQRVGPPLDKISRPRLWNAGPGRKRPTNDRGAPSVLDVFTNDTPPRPGLAPSAQPRPPPPPRCRSHLRRHPSPRVDAAAAFHDYTTAGTVRILHQIRCCARFVGFSQELFLLVAVCHLRTGPANSWKRSSADCVMFVQSQPLNSQLKAASLRAAPDKCLVSCRTRHKMGLHLPCACIAHAHQRGY